MRIGVMRRCQNLTFKVNFLCQKSSESFWFFSLKKKHIFCYWYFLITSFFKFLYFLKWCPIFDSSPLLKFSKFYNFIWPKIFLILYTSLDNFATGSIDILHTSGNPRIARILRKTCVSWNYSNLLNYVSL